MATKKQEATQEKVTKATSEKATASTAPATPPAAEKSAAQDASKAVEKPKATKKEEPKEIPALFIRSKPKSFCRAGHKFTEHGHGIALDVLSEEQIEAITNEPELIVEECTIPADGIVAEGGDAE